MTEELEDQFSENGLDAEDEREMDRGRFHGDDKFKTVFKPSIKEISDIYYRIIANLPVSLPYDLRGQFQQEWKVLEERINNQSLKYRRFKCFKCSNEAKVCHQCVAKEIETAKIEGKKELKLQWAQLNQNERAYKLGVEQGINETGSQLVSIAEKARLEGLEQGGKEEREKWVIECTNTVFDVVDDTCENVIPEIAKRFKHAGFLECLKEIERFFKKGRNVAYIHREDFEELKKKVGK